ncbi:hypothetical protein C2869_06910 [Saccharobesus litoralis]|uniref:VTT domain-containing protein n=1 Tax=Saccharobesus litoralis TaxID=2172099 RepID=A0A2S0VPS0_9ALTE|nr:VTT domain-containing protein [Saccharobesus litoralis]AWB66182.1 hypothetical protein C2869_06910 [Saccharobesus litoralis]
MKALIKVIITLALVFATTFVIAKLTGILSFEQIEAWLIQAKQVSHLKLMLLIVVVLFADLFIAIPVLSICMLSGYLLGAVLGFAASITGILLVGVVGYLLSQKYGELILKRLVKSETERKQMKSLFNQYGFSLIIMSRATPILPEVSACLAGMSKMPFLKFLLAWTLVNIPYAAIANYSGSISSIENPKPAILTAVAIVFVFSTSWLWFQHKVKRQNQISNTN